MKRRNFFKWLGAAPIATIIPASAAIAPKEETASPSQINDAMRSMMVSVREDRYFIVSNGADVFQWDGISDPTDWVKLF